MFEGLLTNQYSTRKEDMPDEFAKPEMNDERIRSWAASIGPNTLEVINRIFRGVQIKEQGYNAALSVLKLSQHYPNDRFEDACQIAIGNAASPRYKYLKAILSSNQDLVLRDRRTKAMPKENRRLLMQTMLMYAAPSITEEVLLMISEETRRKLRELGMDAFVDALDNQEANLNNYVTMDFDQRLMIAVDEFYATKNRDRAKRLMHLAKFRFPDLYYYSDNYQLFQVRIQSLKNYVSFCNIALCKAQNISMHSICE